MKGDQKVIELLNKQLAGELTSIDQNFVDSRVYEDWGLTKLYEQFNHEMQDEQAHASALISRILFLEGTPNVSTRLEITSATNVADMLANDLKSEMDIAAHLKVAIAYCESVKDYDTREILEVLLKDTEEDHIFWLETQLGLIERVGIQNYLQSQM